MFVVVVVVVLCFPGQVYTVAVRSFLPADIAVSLFVCLIFGRMRFVHVCLFNLDLLLFWSGKHTGSKQTNKQTKNNEPLMQFKSNMRHYGVGWVGRGDFHGLGQKAGISLQLKLLPSGVQLLSEWWGDGGGGVF